MEVHSDWLSLLLWSLELFFLSLSLLFVFSSIKCISRDPLLHYNFRVLLLIIILRAPLQSLSRCIVIFHRAFIYGSTDLPSDLQAAINAGKRFQQSEVGFALFFLSIERIFASIDSLYEIRFRSNRCKFLITSLFLFPGFLMLGLFFVNGASLSSSLETSLTLFSYILAAVTTLVLWRFSLSKFARRHSLGMELSAKFATAGNIRASRISFPCILNECICYGIIVLLGILSVAVLHQRAGSDPTKLSHAFDLVAAYQNLFIPLFLTYKRRDIKRESVTSMRSIGTTQTSDVYFQAYRSTWS